MSNPSGHTYSATVKSTQGERLLHFGMAGINEENSQADVLPASELSLPASAGGTDPRLGAVCSPSACAPSFYLHSQQPGVTQPASSLPASRVLLSISQREGRSETWDLSLQPYVYL